MANCEYCGRRLERSAEDETDTVCRGPGIGDCTFRAYDRMRKELEAERAKGPKACAACKRPIDVRELGDYGWRGDGLPMGASVTCACCRITCCLGCARKHFGEQTSELEALRERLESAEAALRQSFYGSLGEVYFTKHPKGDDRG